MLVLDTLYRILASINMLLFVISFKKFMNKKEHDINIRSKFGVIFTYIALIVAIFIGFPFGMVRIQILSIIIAILILICRVFYNLDILDTIINACMYSLIYVLIETSIYWILSITLNLKAYIICLLDFGISLVIIFMSVYFYSELNEIYNKNKYKICILSAIITNILILIFLNIFSNRIEDFYEIIIKNNIKYDKIISTINLSGLVDSVFPYVLVIINIILIFVFLNYVKTEKENSKIQIVNEKLKMQYKYYLDMEENQEKMKQVYHDMNNHIRNLKSMKNNDSKIDDYIDSIEKEVNYNKNIYNTGSALLDVILYEKNKECLKNNIEFNTLIDFKEYDFVEMIDISSIFSNLLDNAIEACVKIDDNQNRYITLRVTKIKGYFVIKCENSKSRKIYSKVDNEDKFITYKKDNFYHGIGIDSIKSSIHKYDGDIRIKEEESKFAVSIYLPI